jgi:hypothetical protein
MELIFDVRKMTQAVVEMKYDVRKMPLGKLTHEQISAGYESLKAIETLLKVWHLGMAYCPLLLCLRPVRIRVHLFTFRRSPRPSARTSWTPAATFTRESLTFSA